MRSGCQWVLAALVLAGCGGSASGPAARSAGGQAAPSGEATRSVAAGRLGAVQARGFLAAHPEALVLDVRNPDEWNDDLGHIEGARQIPLPELPSRLAELEGWKDKPIVVVCRVGVRSQQAADLLLASGYRRVVNLEGGMAAWRESGP